MCSSLGPADSKQSSPSMQGSCTCATHTVKSTDRRGQLNSHCPQLHCSLLQLCPRRNYIWPHQCCCGARVHKGCTWGPVYDDRNMAEIPRKSPTHHHRGFCYRLLQGGVEPLSPVCAVGPLHPLRQQHWTTCPGSAPSHLYGPRAVSLVFGMLGALPEEMARLSASQADQGALPRPCGTLRRMHGDSPY